MSNKNRRRERSIPKEVEDFTKFTFKKFKKETKGYYKNKKKQELAYYETMAEGMQYCVEFLVRYGHIREEKIADAMTVFTSFLKNETFCKRALKMLKNEELSIKDYEYLPIIARNVLAEESKKARQKLVENSDAEVPSHEWLVKLSMEILKKKIKKLEKAGISRSMAFDVLSIVPSPNAMEFSSMFRVRQLFDTLYEYAKTSEVNFEKIFKKVLGEKYYPLIIVVALLEKKERFADLNDMQKTFHTSLTSWCIDTMENEFDQDVIMQILKRYVSSRKRDDIAGKDGNRRYPLSTLSEVDYPHLYKAINSFIRNNEADKKYL